MSETFEFLNSKNKTKQKTPKIKTSAREFNTVDFNSKTTDLTRI